MLPSYPVISGSPEITGYAPRKRIIWCIKWLFCFFIFNLTGDVLVGLYDAVFIQPIITYILAYLNDFKGFSFEIDFLFALNVYIYVNLYCFNVYIYVNFIDVKVYKKVNIMSNKLKSIVLKQRRSRINQAALYLKNVSQPQYGWISEVRAALGMSGVQLAARMGVGRSRVSRLEKAEAEGFITIRTLNEAAEAMGCKLVYAIVPEDSIESIIERQAMSRAKDIVKTASTHMVLEDQALSASQIDERIKGLARDLIEKPSKELWDE